MKVRPRAARAFLQPSGIEDTVDRAAGTHSPVEPGGAIVGNESARANYPMVPGYMLCNYLGEAVSMGFSSGSRVEGGLYRTKYGTIPRINALVNLPEAV